MNTEDVTKETFDVIKTARISPRYTLETLTPINGRFLQAHTLNDNDVFKVNLMVAVLERKRQEKTPQPRDGDIVICVKQDGTVRSDHGHLEDAPWIETGKLAVCVEPYAPFYSSTGCEASGGYWFAVKPEELKYTGKRRKTFWTWGNMGACADGGVYFEAEVNVWTFTDTDGGRVY